MSIKQLKPYLKNLADEIRKWTRTTDKINAQDFPTWMSLLYTTGNDDGYQSGYTSGYDEGEEIGYTIGFNEGHDWGYESGKQAEWNEFWDACQDNGNRTNYESAFYGYSWNDVNFKPKYDILAKGTCTMMFGYSRIETIPCVIDLTQATTANYLFHSSRITTIEKLIVAETTPINQWFAYTYSLKRVIVEGVIGQNGFSVQHSSALDRDSIKSIINALSETTTDKTVTFNKTAVNNAFSINVDDESTYPAGSEFYTLRHSKDNWTFSYV